MVVFLCGIAAVLFLWKFFVNKKSEVSSLPTEIAGSLKFETIVDRENEMLDYPSIIDACAGAGWFFSYGVLNACNDEEEAVQLIVSPFQDVGPDYLA